MNYINKGKRDILIFPKFKNIDKIQEIREKYDELAEILPAHITLAFPFENETIIEKVKGDYWEKFLFMYNQKRGEFTITDKRVFFKGGFITTFSINYEDIESISKCDFGPLIRFIPTGISIKSKEGK